MAARKQFTIAPNEGLDDFKIEEFRTESVPIRSWRLLLHVSATLLIAVLGGYYLYLICMGFGFSQVVSWSVYLSSLVVMVAAICVCFALSAVLFTWAYPNCPISALKGVTRVASDGSITVTSTLSGRQLAKFGPKAKKTVSVGGFGWDSHVGKPENNVPLPVILTVEDEASGSANISLFSLTHDRDSVKAHLPEATLCFTYEMQPNYRAAATRVIHYLPALSKIDCQMAQIG